MAAVSERQVDILIIGAGPAGLAAAIAARESGIESILILERENEPGGILGAIIQKENGRVTKASLSGPVTLEEVVTRTVTIPAI